MSEAGSLKSEGDAETGMPVGAVWILKHPHRCVKILLSVQHFMQFQAHRRASIKAESGGVFFAVILLLSAFCLVPYPHCPCRVRGGSQMTVPLGRGNQPSFIYMHILHLYTLTVALNSAGVAV